MDSDIKDLQSKWEGSKNNLDSSTINMDNLYKKIKAKERDNYFFYYSTITILLVTLMVISLFFYFVAPVKEIVSRIGAGTMIFGLLLRIFIELISIGKAKRINNLDDTLKTAKNTINFYQFRRIIHRIIAPIIVVCYTIGFYMITPEFSLYMELWNVVLMDVSYIIIGILLFIVIRKGVKKEMQKLSEIIKLKDTIME